MDKSLAIQNAQRAAFHRLADYYLETPHMVEHPNQPGKKIPAINQNTGKVHNTVKHNDWYVRPDNITCPSVLIQELPLDGSSNSLVFDFSQTAPQPTTALGNVLLGINNICCVYGCAVFLGVGANAVTRQYYNHGLLAADNAIYQGGATMNMQFEQSQLVKNIGMLDYLWQSGTDFDYNASVKLTNPLRLITGRLGTNQVTINTQPLTGLTFTPNLYVSVQLQVVLGQASGTN